MDTNMKTPRVSVIMPVYNGEKYIKEAVESIVRQTFSDWELFIVNDASTDSTEKILESFKDPRLKIIKNERNLGSVASRNTAFAQIQSEYVAILDADDIAAPTRFQEQVKFLDSNSDFGLVASWTKIISGDGTQIGRVLKKTIPPEKIPIQFLFHNLLAFSSVMMRKKNIPSLPFEAWSVPVEDVALYFKMLPHSKFAILPKILTSYRSHEKGISKVYGEKRLEVMNTLIHEALKKLGIDASPEELKIHRTNYGYAGTDTEQFLKKRERWLLTLTEKNKNTEIYPPVLFEEVLAEKWLESCDANARLGFKLWKMFHSSPLSQKISWRKNFKKLFRLGLKCLVAKDKIGLPFKKI